MSKFNLTAQIVLQAPSNTQQVVNQIRNQLQGITANVTVNANTRQLAQANAQLNSLNNSSVAASRSVSELGKTLGAAARRFGAISIATGTFLGLTRAIKNSLGDAIEFERQMVVLSQTTGKTVSELGGLYNEVTRLSTSLGVSSDGLIKTAIILAQAGLEARKTKAALEVLAKTQLAASFDNIADTTEGAIAILSQFRNEATQAGGDIKFLEQSLEAINQVSKKFAVESADLIAVIRRSGGAFEAAGGSLNELLALFTSVRATTRESAETISTGLRTIFTRIQRTDTIKSLQELGIVLQDVEGKFVGPYEAIKRISEGLSALDPRDFRFAAIVEELGGFRQIGKVIPLIKQFTVAQDALNTAQASSGSLTKDVETAQQSLANQIAKVREEFQALIRKFASSESFHAVAGGALDFARALIKIADAIEPLLPMITALAAVQIGKGLVPAIGALTGVGRRKSQGGKIHAFATGGLVPGQGNRDTVPAMLSPGEFVIRKSSVNKIGAANLAHMNSGGTVQHFNNGTSGTGAKKKKKDLLVSMEENRARVAKKSPAAGKLFSEFDKGLEESLYYGSPKLMKSINKEAAAKDKKKEKEQLKQAKMARLENYRKQIESGQEEISYDEYNPDQKFKMNKSNSKRNAKRVKKLTGVLAKNSLQNVDTEEFVDGGLAKQTREMVSAQRKSTQETFETTSPKDIGAIRLAAAQVQKDLRDTYGGAFLAPEGGIRDLEGKIEPGIIENQIKSYKSYQDLSTIAKTDSQVKKLLDDITQGFEKEKDVKIIAESLSQTKSQAVEDHIYKGVLQAVENGSKELNNITKIGGGGGATQASELLRKTNIDQTIGNIFEAMVANAGAPFSGSDKESANATFDFPKGLGDIAKNFGQNRLADITTDAKTRFSTDNITSLFRKSKNTEAAKITYQIDQLFSNPNVANSIVDLLNKKQISKDVRERVSEKAGLFGIREKFGEQGKKLSEVTQYVSKSEYDKWLASPQGQEYTKYEQQQIKTTQNRITSKKGMEQRAKGGSISDTVPALLTPGEFVVNRKSAQRIGYGALNRMNKTGVAGFAKGGPVAVQKFQTGGQPAPNNPTGGIPASSRNQAQTESLIQQIARSAQSFIFLAGTVGAVATQFLKLEDSTSKAVTETIVFATTMTGIAGTVVDFGSSVIQAIKAMIAAKALSQAGGAAGGVAGGAAGAAGGASTGVLGVIANFAKLNPILAIIIGTVTALAAGFALYNYYIKAKAKAEADAIKQQNENLLDQIQQGKASADADKQYVDNTMRAASIMSKIETQNNSNLQLLRNNATALVNIVKTIAETDKKLQDINANMSLTEAEKAQQSLVSLAVQNETIANNMKTAIETNRSIKSQKNLKESIPTTKEGIQQLKISDPLKEQLQSARESISRSIDKFTENYNASVQQINRSFEEAAKKTDFTDLGETTPLDRIFEDPKLKISMESFINGIMSAARVTADYEISTGNFSGAIDVMTDAKNKVSMFKESQKKMAEAAYKAAQDMLLLNAALEAARKNVSIANQLNAYLDQQLKNAVNFGKQLESANNIINNQIGNFSIQPIEGLDDLSNIVDFESFSTNISNIGDMLGGAGKEMSNQINAVAESISLAKQKLVNVQGLGTIGEEQGTPKGEALINQVLKPLEGLGAGFDSFRARLQTSLRKAMSPDSAEGGVNITEAERQKAFADLEASMKPFMDLFNKLTAVQSERLTQYSSYLNAISAAEDRHIATMEKFVDIEIKSAARFEQATGKPLSIQFKEAMRQQRREMGLRAAGGAIQTSRGAGDIVAMGQALANVEEKRRKNIDEQNKAQKQGVLGSTALANLADEEKKLNRQSKEYRKTLEGLTDQSERAADVLGEIEKEKAKRETGIKILEDFVTGSFSEQNDILKNFTGMRIAAQTGTLQNFDPETKKSVMSLIKELAAVNPAFENLRKNLIFMDAIRAGVDPRIAKTLATATPVEEKMLRQLQIIAEEERLALQMLSQSDAANEDYLKEIASGIKQLVTSFQEDARRQIKTASETFSEQQIQEQELNQKNEAAKLKARQEAEEKAAKEKADIEQRERDNRLAAIDELIKINEKEVATRKEILMAEEAKYKKLQEQLKQQQDINNEMSTVDEKNRIALDNIFKQTTDTGYAIQALKKTINDLDLALIGLYNKQNNEQLQSKEEPIAKRKGGVIYANKGFFASRGTDTVPAMLTPGEFVIRKSSVQKYGSDFMRALNDGNIDPKSLENISGYATGGNVSLGKKLEYAIGRTTQKYLHTNLFPKMQKLLQKDKLQTAQQAKTAELEPIIKSTGPKPTVGVRSPLNLKDQKKINDVFDKQKKAFDELTKKITENVKSIKEARNNLPEDVKQKNRDAATTGAKYANYIRESRFQNKQPMAYQQFEKQLKENNKELLKVLQSGRERQAKEIESQKARRRNVGNNAYNMFGPPSAMFGPPTPMAQAGNNKPNNQIKNSIFSTIQEPISSVIKTGMDAISNIGGMIFGNQQKAVKKTPAKWRVNSTTPKTTFTKALPDEGLPPSPINTLPPMVKNPPAPNFDIVKKTEIMGPPKPEIMGPPKPSAREMLWAIDRSQARKRTANLKEWMATDPYNNRRFDERSTQVMKNTPKEQENQAIARAENFSKTRQAQRNRERFGPISPLNLKDQQKINSVFDAQKKAQEERMAKDKGKVTNALNAKSPETKKLERDNAALNGKYINYLKESKAQNKKPMGFEDFKTKMAQNDKSLANTLQSNRDRVKANREQDKKDRLARRSPNLSWRDMPGLAAYSDQQDQIAQNMNPVIDMQQVVAGLAPYFGKMIKYLENIDKQISQQPKIKPLVKEDLASIDKFAKDATTPGSIYVHDIHTEKIFTDILSSIDSLSNKIRSNENLIPTIVGVPANNFSTVSNKPQQDSQFRNIIEELKSTAMLGTALANILVVLGSVVTGIAGICVCIRSAMSNASSQIIKSVVQTGELIIKELKANKQEIIAELKTTTNLISASIVNSSAAVINYIISTNAVIVQELQNLNNSVVTGFASSSASIVSALYTTSNNVITVLNGMMAELFNISVNTLDANNLLATINSEIISLKTEIVTGLNNVELAIANGLSNVISSISILHPILDIATEISGKMDIWNDINSNISQMLTLIDALNNKDYCCKDKEKVIVEDRSPSDMNKPESESGFERSGYGADSNAIRQSITAAPQVKEEEKSIFHTLTTGVKAAYKALESLTNFKVDKISSATKLFEMVGEALDGTLGAVINVAGEVFDTGKELAEQGIKSIGDVASKAKVIISELAENTLAKTGGKILGKKVPLLGVGVGAMGAIDRGSQGDYVGAAGEMASGIAGIFPGIGTAISTAIDAALLAWDVSGLNKSADETAKAVESVEKHGTKKGSLYVNDTHVVGLLNKQNPLPVLQDINKSIARTMLVKPKNDSGQMLRDIERFNQKAINDEFRQTIKEKIENAPYRTIDKESQKVMTTPASVQEKEALQRAKDFSKTRQAQRNRERFGPISPLNLKDQQKINAAFEKEKQEQQQRMDAERDRVRAAKQARNNLPEEQKQARRDAATLNAKYYNYIKEARAKGQKPMKYAEFEEKMKQNDQQTNDMLQSHRNRVKTQREQDKLAKQEQLAQKQRMLQQNMMQPLWEQQPMGPQAAPQPPVEAKPPNDQGNVYNNKEKASEPGILQIDPNFITNFNTSLVTTFRQFTDSIPSAFNPFIQGLNNFMNSLNNFKGFHMYMTVNVDGMLHLGGINTDNIVQAVKNGIGDLVAEKIMEIMPDPRRFLS